MKQLTSRPRYLDTKQEILYGRAEVNIVSISKRGVLGAAIRSHCHKTKEKIQATH